MHNHVFEVQISGTWIVGLDDDATANEALGLLHYVESCLADAALSLSLFEAKRAELVRYWDPMIASARRERDAKRRREIEDRVAADWPDDLTHGERMERLHKVWHQAEVEVCREHWRDGELPGTYQQRLPFLHARSFVTALESIRKAFQAMQKLPGMPTEVAEVVRGIDEAVPAMRHVRNSIQHGEDRIRGLEHGRTIDLKPVDSRMVKAPDGFLVYDSLDGTRFGCTMADGQFGEVDVSPTTAGIMTTAVQQIVDAFQWDGPTRHVPS